MTQDRRLEKKWFRSTVFHWMLSVFTILTVAFAAVLIGLYTVFAGPSQSMSDSVIDTMMGTSALKFIPYLFLPEEKVNESLDRTDPRAVEAVTNTDMYSFSAQKEEVPQQPGEDPSAEQFSAGGSGMTVAKDEEKKEDKQEAVPDFTGDDGYEDEFGVGKGIRIIRIVGGTYKGYIAIVDDPSRVSVGTCGAFGGKGKRIEDIAKSYDAILAVNGGAFEDGGGNGSGGIPLGLVVSQGTWYRDASSSMCSVGFDKEDRLIVGNLTAQQARAVDYRDALSFGPALIVNGDPAVNMSANSGLQPRTAIGQRADGAVLLLVLDGRQLDSLGASYADMVDILLKYGAINACNLDGGSSSVMVVNGKQINDGIALTGSRRLPTAVIVK